MDPAITVDGDVVHDPNAVSEPLEWVTGTISGNRLPFLVLSFGLVGLSLWLDQRSGGGEVDALLHIDEEVAEIEAEDPPPPDTP